MPTKSQAQADTIAAQLKAGNPLLWVNSREEARTELWLAQAAKAAKLMPYFWDCAQGPTDLSGKPVSGMESAGNDAGATLGLIAERARNGAREVWVLRDIHKWAGDNVIGVQVIRQLRNLVRQLPNTGVRVIALVPGVAVPPDLSGDAVVIDWPLPDREELGQMLDTAMANAVRDHGDKIEKLNGNRDAAIDAAIGLSGPEAEGCFATSLVVARKIDPVIIAGEKKAIIAKSGSLQWMEPLKNGFDSVGGLDVIKTWTLKRMLAYTPAARVYGLSVPKGIVCVGISGCGKTLIAKAIAWALGRVPLLRWDMGASKSKFLGESEANFRNTIKVIESVGRCVVLVDEMEKMLAGATGPSGDSGTSADQLATFLTWMQERQGTEAFVIATCNDVTQLPPEVLRKGRWDELFWVDLPTSRERVEVLQAALRANGRTLGEDTDWNALATVTDKFTGAEIASLVPDALFATFADGERALTADDIVRAASTVAPLAKTAEDKIEKMRNWAKGRTRLATTPDAERVVAPTGRSLDL